MSLYQSKLTHLLNFLKLKLLVIFNQYLFVFLSFQKYLLSTSCVPELVLTIVQGSLSLVEHLFRKVTNSIVYAA